MIETGSAGRYRTTFNRFLPAGILVLISLAVLTSAFSSGFALFQADEAYLAWPAKQVADGRVLYRDFFYLVAPLTPLLCGLLLHLFGDSLAVLRLASIVWLSITALVFYALLRATPAPRLWAALAALLLPALMVVFWPVTSHHWFALGFGLAALTVVSVGRPTNARWFTGGLLAALTGLSVQVEGAWVVAVLFLSLLLRDMARKPIAAAWLAAGCALPVAVFAAFLAAQHTLDDAVRQVVMWPARHYKQTGGYNDVTAQPVVIAPPEHVGSDPIPMISFYIALLLPILLIALLGLSPYLLKKRLELRRTWLLNGAATVLALALFLRGRADWTHLVFWMPFLLFLLYREVDWSSRGVRLRVVQAWVLAAVLIASARFIPLWLREPPNPARVLAIDSDFQRTQLPTLLDELPQVRERGQSVLYLGPAASGLYFYWSPAPPPADWLTPPDLPYNSNEEYRALAEFATAVSVPWIVIPYDYVESFINDASPLQDVLRRDYRPAFRTSWGMAYSRITNR